MLNGLPRWVAIIFSTSSFKWFPTTKSSNIISSFRDVGLWPTLRWECSGPSRSPPRPPPPPPLPACERWPRSAWANRSVRVIATYFGGVIYGKIGQLGCFGSWVVYSLWLSFSPRHDPRWKSNDIGPDVFDWMNGRGHSKSFVITLTIRQTHWSPISHHCQRTIIYYTGWFKISHCRNLGFVQTLHWMVCQTRGCTQHPCQRILGH